MNKAERAYRYLIKAFVFVVVLVAILWGINSFMQPVWFYENNYHTYRSFYEEPRDTIETVFVGASMTIYGYSPMEMYAQNGICAYNLASTSQPVMMSYYWVKEAYRLQSKTLDTVVFDVSMLRRKSTEEDLRKSLDGMEKSSPVKKEAIEDIADDSIDALYYQFPILGYHDRWSAVEYGDFVKYEDNLERYVRGYFMDFNRVFDTADIRDIPIPAQLIDSEAAPTTFENESLYYLNQLIKFCDEHDIRLVLCKTPSPSNWSSNNHNGVQEIADTYGLDFVDLEIEPHLTELDFCAPLDSRDLTKHLNYYGAMKLSRWMSTYLSEHCGNRDVRGDAAYAFMDEQLKQYNQKVTLMAEATMCTDVGEYLEKVISADNYTVMIAVKDEAAKSLTSEQRLTFERLGLTTLSTIQAHDSYLAMVTDGTVDFEQVDRNADRFGYDVDNATVPVEEDDEEAAEEQALDLDEIEYGDWDKLEDLQAEASPITKSGTLADGMHYVIQSGGYWLGFTASITLDGEEYAKNKRGINIVVYDNDAHRVVDSALFDTWASSTRDNPNYQEALDQALSEGTKYSRLTSNLQALYCYNWRYDYSYDAKKLHLRVGLTGLYDYLEHYCHREGLMVFVSVKDEAAGALTDEGRAALVGLGMSEIANLGYHDSYCAVFENGHVSAERLGKDSDPVFIEGVGYTVESAGLNAGSYANILIEESGDVTNYSPNSRGFNIVVYNPKLDILVDTYSFDTHLYGVSVPA